MGRKCPLPLGAKSRAPAEPWVPGAASALHLILPMPEPCCPPRRDIIIIIINHLLEMDFQQLSWVLGSCPSHPWAARSSRVADTAPSLPSALPPAAVRTDGPVLASSPGLWGRENSILMVLLRNPRVIFCVPSHKLLRQNVQGRNKSCLCFRFLLKKLAGN